MKKALLAAFTITVLGLGVFLESSSEGKLGLGSALAADATTWVDGGTITSKYGDRVRGGQTEQHPGVDIGKQDPTTKKWQSGATVKAGCAGTVVKVYTFDKHYKVTAPDSDWFKNFNLVVVKCTEGEFAGKFILYAHTSSISVTQGQAVTANTEVGKMGGLGHKCDKTFGPHVHIEVRDPDPDDPGTPSYDETQWDAPDESRVASGSYDKANDPVAGAGTKKKGSASGSSSAGGTPESLVFSYTVTNDADSQAAIDYFRVRYEGTAPYFNVQAPSGWQHESYGESPEAMTWYAFSPGSAIQPGSSLSGFSFEAEGVVPTYLPFFIAPDDAGFGLHSDFGFLVLGGKSGVADGIAELPDSWWNLGAEVELKCITPGDTTYDPDTWISDQSCTGDPQLTNKSSDMTTSEVIPHPSSQFASGLLVGFYDPDFWLEEGTYLPLGAVMGRVVEDAFIGKTNNPCNTNLSLVYAMLNGTTDKTDTFVVDPDHGNILDDDCHAGNDLPNHVDCYPDYNNRVFDPDGPGGKDPIAPLVRLTGYVSRPGTEILVQFMVFDKGALSGANGFQAPHPYSQFDASWGYPSVILLLNPSAPAAPSAINFFCSPMTAVITLYGVTQDLTDTIAPPQMAAVPVGVDEGGHVTRKTPTTTGTHYYHYFGLTYRNADGDPYPTNYDSCNFCHNFDDQFNIDSDGDMIDPCCDPNPTTNEGDDYDSDGYLNADDYCPLIYNPYPQTEGELSAPWPQDAGPRQDEVADDCEGTGFVILPEADGCLNAIDDDPIDDGTPENTVYINDGCPALGAPETDCGPDEAAWLDDDGDTRVNDGCTAINGSEDGANPYESGYACNNNVDDDHDGWFDEGCDSDDDIANGTYRASLVLLPMCIGETDDDGDGWCNDDETALGSPPDSAPGGDHDGDGFANPPYHDNGGGPGSAYPYYPCWGGGTTSCVDNCPIDYNPSQADADQDGIGDACDLYPHITSDGNYDNLVGPPWDTYNDNADPCPQQNNADPLSTQDDDHDGIGNRCDPMPSTDFSPFGRPENISLVYDTYLSDAGARPPVDEKLGMDGVQQVCDDGIDNDGDTDFDRWDSDCSGAQTNDRDGDGATDGVEWWTGTDRLDDCSDDCDPDNPDTAKHDAWSFDVNRDCWVNSSDILKYPQAISMPIKKGILDPKPYQQRFDMAPDNWINSSDIIRFSQRLSMPTSCTNP